MCLVRGTIAKLCPNMINFGALDFRECRSEEVISFFWRSVENPSFIELIWHVCFICLNFCSIDDLLIARHDPEELLFNLGFGGSAKEDFLDRIPGRFLQQPSQAKGISLYSFLNQIDELERGCGKKKLEMMSNVKFVRCCWLIALMQWSLHTK